MNQLEIDLRFTDRDTATQVKQLLVESSDHAQESARLEVQEPPSDSFQAGDWTVLSLLLEFGGDVAKGVAGKIGELIVDKITSLARTIRSSLRDKSDASAASDGTPQSVARAKKTTVTIFIQDRRKSIEITAETADAEITIFAESIAEEYET